MRKIKYLDDMSQIEGVYSALFDHDYKDMQKAWELVRPKLLQYTQIDNKEHVYPQQIRPLFTRPYNQLVSMYLDYIKFADRLDDSDKDLLKTAFRYSNTEGKRDGLQPRIAEFFMQYANELDIHVCHYCELSYVNAYGLSSFYKSFARLLKSGNEKAIRKYVRTENGKEYANSKVYADIVQLKNQEEDVVDNFDRMTLWGGKKPTKSDRIMRNQSNHFDLDHFLPKSKCPLVALSLYNLVPSCAVCNEKLKGKDELGGNDENLWIALSPTSPTYNFGELKLHLNPLDWNQNKRASDHEEEYMLEFQPSTSVYQKVVEEFKLEERYNYHKTEALSLLDKMHDYPKEKIAMIESLFNGSRTSADIINDLFGLKHNKEHHRIMEKFHRDIIEQAGRNDILETLKQMEDGNKER